MNDTILIQLKILVEQGIRPVTASTARKRKMREELLAHVSGVFEEESAQLGDDRAALERTALRFGNAAEVTRQLQESVPRSDGFLRFWEGRPDESTLRSTLRFASIEAGILLVACGIAFFVAGWHSAWSREELIAVVSGVGSWPFWLVGPLWFFGTALLAHWMEKSLLGPQPLICWPRVGLVKALTLAWAVPAARFALIAGGLCLLLLFCIRVGNWRTHPAEWGRWIQLWAGVLLACFGAAASVLVAWFLVQSVAARRRYHKEWANLQID